jgi:hypothetical protein
LLEDADRFLGSTKVSAADDYTSMNVDPVDDCMFWY